MKAGRSKEVLRFRVSERRVHWAIAIPFLICYVTALILVVVYNPNPLRPYREVVSWIHRISGLCLLIFPGLAIMRSAGDFSIHFYNIRQAWVWVVADLKWLLLMGLAALFKKIRLPEQGKFNAGQKLNFMMVMSTYPLYILTGLAMWVSGAALLAWLIHVGMAVVATPFILGHIFMATVPRSTRKGLQGMISGFVDSAWAKHHHARWYRESFDDRPAPTPVQAVEAEAKDDRSVFTGGVPGTPKLAAETHLTPLSRQHETSSIHAKERGDVNAAGAPQPVALRAIVSGLRFGERKQWIGPARAAIEAAAHQGDWELAADLFRELWPDARDLNLNRQDMHAIIRKLLDSHDLKTAVKASALRILNDSRDPIAINCLMTVAERALRRQASQDSIKIYDFLLRHCAASPYAGYFRRGIELAEEWSVSGGSHLPTLGEMGSKADPEARV